MPDRPKNNLSQSEVEMRMQDQFPFGNPNIHDGFEIIFLGEILLEMYLLLYSFNKVIE